MRRIWLIGAWTMVCGACGGVHGGPGTVTLSWDGPTTRADGSALRAPIEYRIYESTVPGGYASSVPLKSVSASSVGGNQSGTVEQLAPGTHYFVVTAVDSSGAESVYSNEVLAYVQAEAAH